jgi:lysophospholipase L1-like esterase
LLGSLLNCLFSNFRVCASPEEYLVRADGKDKPCEKSGEQRIVLVGASNLGHAVPHFAGTKLEFVPVIKPGWVATVDNVVELAGIVKSLAPTTSMFVFDLFGNSSIRFEQFDGTTALPFRANGKYHLGGKIVTAPVDIFRRVIENVIPVIKEKGNKPCVIVPPLPRYLFARCCSSPEHCTNMQEKNYQETIMGGFIRLRTDLIKQLVTLGLTNFKVMDACCPANCSLTADISERIAEMRKITAKDGVHFIDAGYKKIAERVTACMAAMLTVDSNDTSQSQRKPTVHFWRGFRSQRGSLLPRMGNSNHHSLSNVISRGSHRGSRGQLRSHGRSKLFHPYRRW